MKNIITILAITTLFSCGNKEKPVIRSKTYSGNIIKLPDCICQYTYSDGGLEWVGFQDSCSKYNILDTITGTPKNK